MDAHYDQVMKARQQAGEGVKLYFAYSTILDRASFERWRQDHGYQFFDLQAGDIAEACDVELVYDFVSRWWGGRVAGLQDAPGQTVWGKVFEIAEVDWPIIRHKEGAVTNMCVERPVRVRVGGKEVEAIAFTTAPNRRNTTGPLSDTFIEALERGAESAGLPQTWVKSLRKSAC